MHSAGKSATIEDETDRADAAGFPNPPDLLVLVEVYKDLRDRLGMPSIRNPA